MPQGQDENPDQKWKDQLDHSTAGFVLVNENFEFPDLLGAAYEYLIKFIADSAGKKAENSNPGRGRSPAGATYQTPGREHRLRSYGLFRWLFDTSTSIL
jgi:hypothetical protein